MAGSDGISEKEEEPKTVLKGSIVIQNSLQGLVSRTGTGSVWIRSLLDPYLDQLHHGSVFFLMALLVVAGFLGTAGCPFTIPTMLGIAGVAGAEDADASAKKRGLLLGAGFGTGMWLGMILLGALAGSASVLVAGPVRGGWSLAMAALALFMGFVILGRRGNGFPAFSPGFPFRSALSRLPEIPAAFVVGLFYSAGAPLVSLLFVAGLGIAKMTPEFGALLGLAFGLGRSLPFLLAGVASDAVAGCRIGENRWLRVTGGSLMFLVAGYYLWLSRAFL